MYIYIYIYITYIYIYIYLYICVIGEVLRDYGWELLAHGTHSPKVARWPRLLESLPVMPDGRLILHPVSTWEEARSSLLSCATARTLVGALLGLQDACCDVRQDLWSQCCDGSCVPSRSVLPRQCHGCGATASVWVHQCASVPLCGTCKERADRGWPKARWALRHSGKMSSSAWKTIQGGLKSVRVEGVRCPGAPSAALPLLLWWAALEATCGYSGCGITEEMVKAWWGPGVMQIDGVKNSGCTCYRPCAGRSGGGSA